MKRLFLAASVALMAYAVSARGRWLEKTHDFGVIAEEGGTVYCDFRLVNTGSEPMAIIDVRANCGCTRPEYSTDPIAPGDTAVIRVGYAPEGRPGQFAKKVNVDCDIEPLRSTLTISGTVVGSEATLKARFPFECDRARLRARNIPFGQVLRGETKGQYLECINASSDTLRPRVEQVPKYVTAIVEPSVVPPGERFAVATVINTGKADTWGDLDGSMLLYPDKSSAEPFEIGISAVVAEDFSKLTPQQMQEAPVISVSDMALDLERLPRNSAPLTRTFTITNAGKSPLIIRRITSSDPAVEVSLKDMRVKPGKTVKGEVKVDPAKVVNPRLLNARITITANAPGQPVSTLRVVAELVD